MYSNVTIGLAFFAGLLSFISPCVLPLVPAYISYLSGRASQQVATELRPEIPAARNAIPFGVVLHGLFFIGGFTLIFVGFGLLVNASVRIFQLRLFDIRQLLMQAGGILIIFFGLHILGVTGWTLRFLITRVDWAALGSLGTGIQHFLDNIQAMLYGDTRKRMNPQNPYGYVGSGLMGVAFAAGWSPCIGPILGAILTLSATANTNESFWQAGLLLFAYSLGLGVPFLLAALALDRLRGVMRWMQRRMRLIELVSGVFLIGMGLLLYSGTLMRLAQIGSGLANFSYNLEVCGTGVVEGKVPLLEMGKCIDLNGNYVK